MNTNSELDRIVSNWLENRVVDPPRGSLQAALARADQTPQQPHRWLPSWFGRKVLSHDRRKRIMFSTTAVAASVAAFALVAAFVNPQGATEPMPPASSGATFSVAVEGGDFRTITEAVAAAQDGDTILVEPGTYVEALVIESDITIAGTGDAPRAVVIAIPLDAPRPREDIGPLHEAIAGLEAPARPAAGVQLLGSDATLRNLQVMGQDDGVAVLVRGGEPTLENVIVRHEAERDTNQVLAGGLFIDGAAAPTVRGGQVWHRVQVDDASSASFEGALLQYGKMIVQSGSHLGVRDSTVFASYVQPITIVDGATADIVGTRFHDGGLYVLADAGAPTSVAVEGNTFTSAGAAAVRLDGPGGATITGNTFDRNHTGIDISDGDAVVRDNAFVVNDTAVSLSGSDSEVTGNEIVGGVIGISVADGGSPMIEDNSIQDARSRGVIIGTGTSPTVEGNTICGSSINLLVEADANPQLGENDLCSD